MPLHFDLLVGQDRRETLDAPLGVFQKEEFPLSLPFDSWNCPLFLIDVLVGKLWVSQQRDLYMYRSRRARVPPHLVLAASEVCLLARGGQSSLVQ
jgi:hypothetical protein